MSELPDLPPAPRWDLPPHVGGVAAARSTGRRRRAGWAAGAAAVLALVTAAAVVLPRGGDGSDSLVADDGPTSSPSPVVDRPVLLGELTDPTSVRLCLDGGACRTVDQADEATWLRDALSTALPAERDQAYCEALGPTYSLVFRAGETVAPQVVVRTVCGPTTSAGQDYVVDPLVLERVQQAHSEGVVDAPAFPRGATRLEVCHGDVGQRSCLGPGQDRLDEFAALLSAGGESLRLGEVCSAGQPVARIQADYPDGRRVTATAGAECGPLTLADGLRYGVTERARSTLLQPAPTSPPAAPTGSSSPVAASPPAVATDRPEGGSASCDFRDVTSRAYGSPPPAREVERPPAGADVRDRRVVLVTNRGEVGLELLGTRAPCAAHNLAWLGAQGYYDGTSCHRVTTEGIFVVQCGDPSGTGAGHPGYAFDDEALEGSTYPRGTLAMANSGPGTNGSQFFMVWKASRLPPSYTVFGRVDVAGLAVLDEVARGGTEEGTGDGRPKLPLTITDVRLG